MRLDMFLKVSRLLPRRSVAHEFCEKNLIRVNGQTAKPSKTVTAGDVMEIKRRDRSTTLKVLSVPTSKQMSKEAAAALYEITQETRNEDQI